MRDEPDSETYESLPSEREVPPPMIEETKNDQITNASYINNENLNDMYDNTMSMLKKMKQVIEDTADKVKDQLAQDKHEDGVLCSSIECIYDNQEIEFDSDMCNQEEQPLSSDRDNTAEENDSKQSYCEREAPPEDDRLVEENTSHDSDCNRVVVSQEKEEEVVNKCGKLVIVVVKDDKEKSLEAEETKQEKVEELSVNNEVGLAADQEATCAEKEEESVHNYDESLHDETASLKDEKIKELHQEEKISEHKNENEEIVLWDFYKEILTVLTRKEKVTDQNEVSSIKGQIESF